MNKIGIFVKEAREARGLSQKELSVLCGVSDSEISKFERGLRKNQNIKMILALAKALGYHPFDLLLAGGYITESDLMPSQRLRDLELLDEEEFKEVQLFIDYLNYKHNNV